MGSSLKFAHMELALTAREIDFYLCLPPHWALAVGMGQRRHENFLGNSYTHSDLHSPLCLFLGRI
jgi:hypothetical protein